MHDNPYKCKYFFIVIEKVQKKLILLVLSYTELVKKVFTLPPHKFAFMLKL